MFQSTRRQLNNPKSQLQLICRWFSMYTTLVEEIKVLIWPLRQQWLQRNFCCFRSFFCCFFFLLVCGSFAVYETKSDERNGRIMDERRITYKRDACTYAIHSRHSDIHMLVNTPQEIRERQIIHGDSYDFYLLNAISAFYIFHCTFSTNYCCCCVRCALKCSVM